MISTLSLAQNIVLSLIPYSFKTLTLYTKYCCSTCRSKWGIGGHFTLHIFSSSFFTPWYFSSFLCSFFLMLISLSTARLSLRLLLLVHYCYVQLVSRHQFVCLYLKSYIILIHPRGHTHFHLHPILSTERYTVPTTWL